MKSTSLTTRALAVIALTASLITVGQLPGSPVKIANASFVANDVTTTNFPARISAGESFMCIYADNEVMCSGRNDQGQLGDGTTTNRNYLKAITHDSKIKSPMAIATGNAHACAISGSASVGDQGRLYCWGDNQFGQLGDGTFVDKLLPTLVANNNASGFVNAEVRAVFTGNNHTCAITTINGVNRLFCWGLNNKGQLGDTTTTNSNLPIAVQGVFASGGVSITSNSSFYMTPQATAGAEHTCAGATSNTKIYCWGENSSGQLGNNSTTDSSTPVSTNENVPGASNTYNGFIAAGAEFTCLVIGSVRCWGDNAVGQMGDGTTTDALVPTAVPNNGGFTNSGMSHIAAGGQTICVARSGASSETLWCWGANNAGQVGDGTTQDRNRPTLVANNAGAGFTNGILGYSSGGGMAEYAKGISLGRSIADGFACVTQWCWGGNDYGQLAQNNTTDVVLPSKVKIGVFTPDDVTGATVTAAYTSAGVVVTFGGLPASTVTTARVTVAPKTKALLPNQIVSMTSKSYMAKSFSGASLPVVVNGGFSVTVPNLVTSMYSAQGPPTQSNEAFDTSVAYHLTYEIIGVAATGYPDGWRLRPTQTAGQELSVSGIGTTSSSSAATTAPAASTPAASVTPSYANAIPGVTVTDPKVYTTAAPTKVAGDSAISVLTPAQAKTQDIVSKTPSVCLPNDEDLVFLDEGRCIAEVVNVKTRKVLRTLKTTVVDDDIADLQVGNEIAVLSPLYFYAGTTTFKPSSIARLNTLKSKILSAGSVLVAGHSGVLMGNTPENIALSKQRAQVAVKALKARGSKGPFAIAAVGALDPATTKQTPEAQDKNRRVVIVLIP